ncbi:MAG TPA: hypothetical protein VKM36_07405, partial [Balneolaceae bacterium]|nr:hypothetical protein [Balneolaceae bacterium]
MLVTLLYCFDAKAQHDPFAISFDGSRLVYFSDAENNRIPDYSHAGYRGGGVNLPNVPVKIEIGPIE